MIRFLWILFGMFVGSVLTWAADRLPRFSSRGIVPPSRSTSRPRLAVWDLLSSIVHQGPRALPNSFRLEIAVEVLSAALFPYLWERFGPSRKMLVMVIIVSFFLLIAIIDLRYRLVPNALIYPAVAATLLLQLMGPGQSLPTALLGGAVGLAPFLLVALLRPGDIGGGDVKLAGLIGLMVGFPLVLWALILGTVTGGLTAALLLLTHRGGPKSHMPYAPFLCLGALCCLIAPLPVPTF